MQIKPWSRGNPKPEVTSLRVGMAVPSAELEMLLRSRVGGFRGFSWSCHDFLKVLRFEARVFGVAEEAVRLKQSSDF